MIKYWSGRINLHLFLLVLLLLGKPVQAGTFLSSEKNPDSITYPTGYDGSGGELLIDVAISDQFTQAKQMEQPVRNVINTYNRLRQQLSGTQSRHSGYFSAELGDFDLETALVHEFGHCLGLGHVNGPHSFTMAGQGANARWDTAPGADNSQGTADDIRRDDINFYWFQKNLNDPFAEVPSVVDSSNMSRDLQQLPQGDRFPINATRTTSGLLGYNNHRASVMYSVVSKHYHRRKLIADDVATLKLASSGFDRVAGTKDDYQIRLRYVGIGKPADITVYPASAFASCSFGLEEFSPTSFSIKSGARVNISPDRRWYYNQQSNNRSPQLMLDETLVSRINENAEHAELAIFSASDADNDQLQWQASSLVDGAKINLDDAGNSGISVYYTPPRNFHGQDEISISVMDELGSQTTLMLAVTVDDMIMPLEDESSAETDGDGFDVASGGGNLLLYSVLFLILIVLLRMQKKNT